MILTARQITAFFENTGQMGSDNCTRVDSLDAEDISTVNDMAEWKAEDWDT